jgi:hypothetical protein
VAYGQDVNADGVNAYKRVLLCANYGEAFLNPSVFVDSLSRRPGSSKSARGEPDELRSCPPDIATRLTSCANRERC